MVPVRLHPVHGAAPIRLCAAAPGAWTVRGNAALVPGHAFVREAATGVVISRSRPHLHHVAVMTAIVAVASGCAVSYDANVADVIAGVVSMMPDAAYAAHVVLGLTPTVVIPDSDSLVLKNAAESATFESGGRTYLAVTSFNDHGVQIFDVTDPSRITAAGSIADGGNTTDTLELFGAWRYRHVRVRRQHIRRRYSIIGMTASRSWTSPTRPASTPQATSTDDRQPLSCQSTTTSPHSSQAARTYAAVAAYDSQRRPDPGHHRPVTASPPQEAS